MTVIILCFCVWIYLFIWSYCVNNYRFNWDHKIETILLLIFYSPIIAFILFCIGIIEVIISSLIIIELPYNCIKRNKNFITKNFLKDFNNLIKNTIIYYKNCIQLLKYLNKKDSSFDYFFVDNVHLIASYFVTIIECGVSKEYVDSKINDYIYSRKNGIKTAEWIAKDDFLEETEDCL